MSRRHDGGARCPKCDNRLAVVSERSTSNGGTTVRYILKCFACGYRDTLEEVSILRVGDSLKVRVSASASPHQGTRRS